jgi:hypothetical protein
MAFKMQITVKNNFNDDVIFNNVYAKIEMISGNKEKIRIDLIYKRPLDEMIVLKQCYFFAPDLNGSNFIKQAYEHLKTLPEFAGATDC